MEVAFTGTRHGATDAQIRTLEDLWVQRAVHRVHVGMCVGADEQAAEVAVRLGLTLDGHPPTDQGRYYSKRSESLIPPQHVRAAKGYIARDRDMVIEGRELYATPYQAVQPKSTRGSGTWYTIEYARSLGRRIYIIWPDGTVKEEWPT